jgi:hypothetical protein
LQLSKKLKEISQKSDPVNFSFSINKTTPLNSNDKTREIEEALNICSMNVTIMRRKLEEFEEGARNRSNSKGSFLSKLFNSSPQNFKITSKPILEHSRLVILFLEGRIGRITENLEAYKLRKRSREKLLSVKQEKEKKVVFTANTNNNINTISSTSTDPKLSMLQVENTRMIEEMSRGLFETLSSTESQILEISRLQSTLQNHLSMQHDLTCRLFEDSITTAQDTQKGNEYLKKTGKDSSTMRKFLVTLILTMSLLLLLLHYFNK